MFVLMIINKGAYLTLVNLP